MISSKPEHVELILTGRSAPEEILKAAYLVTEITLVKHPFYKGVDER